MTGVEIFGLDESDERIEVVIGHEDVLWEKGQQSGTLWIMKRDSRGSIAACR